MHHRRFTAAAWLPCPSSPEAHEAGQSAVAVWLHEQERAANTPTVLVTDTFPVDERDPLLGAFRRGSTHFTLRSAGPPTYGPILTYRPTRAALNLAQRMALSAICVWELEIPVRGWAGQVGAIDLRTGLVTVPHPDLTQYLDHLMFAGNNGYTDTPGARDARRILTEMRTAGLLDQDIPSALAAHGLSVDAQERIASMIKTL